MDQGYSTRLYNTLVGNPAGGNGYNAIGRTYGSGSVDANNPLGFFQKRANSIENAIGTTLMAPISGIKDTVENMATSQNRKDWKANIRDVYRKYGFRDKQDYDDQLYAAERAGNQEEADRLLHLPGLQADLQAVASSNAAEAKSKAKDYNAWRTDNSYLNQKINQDEGKFAGSAINTLSTATDVLGLTNGPLGNAIQGGIEGFADELEQNGLRDFSWDRAGQNALSGAVTGAVTGAFNKALGGTRIGQGQNLFKGGNKLTQSLNDLGSKTALGRLGSSIATGAARGAMSGAVGGATGAGLQAALNNQDVLGSAFQGALQGARGGAVSGAVMTPINSAIGNTNLMKNVRQAQQNWRNSGKNFGERFENTLNSGDSAVGNFGYAVVSDLMDAWGNKSETDTGDTAGTRSGYIKAPDARSAGKQLKYDRAMALAKEALDAFETADPYGYEESMSEMAEMEGLDWNTAKGKREYTKKWLDNAAKDIAGGGEHRDWVAQALEDYVGEPQLANGVNPINGGTVENERLQSIIDQIRGFDNDGGMKTKSGFVKPLDTEGAANELKLDALRKKYSGSNFNEQDLQSRTPAQDAYARGEGSFSDALNEFLEQGGNVIRNSDGTTRLVVPGAQAPEAEIENSQLDSLRRKYTGSNFNEQDLQSRTPAQDAYQRGEGSFSDALDEFLEQGGNITRNPDGTMSLVRPGETGEISNNQRRVNKAIDTQRRYQSQAANLTSDIENRIGGKLARPVNALDMANNDQFVFLQGADGQEYTYDKTNGQLTVTNPQTGDQEFVQAQAEPQYYSDQRTRIFTTADGSEVPLTIRNWETPEEVWRNFVNSPEGRGYRGEQFTGMLDDAQAPQTQAPQESYAQALNRAIDDNLTGPERAEILAKYSGLPEKITATELANLANNDETLRDAINAATFEYEDMERRHPSANDIVSGDMWNKIRTLYANAQNWDGPGNALDDYEKSNGVRILNNNPQTQAPQSNRDLQQLQGMKWTIGEAKQAALDHIENVLRDSGIDDLNIKGIDVHGSRVRGNARNNSDLDVVVEYDGNMREDALFNLLNDAENKLALDGIDVDINPIRARETGTLPDYMQRSNEYDAEIIKMKNNNPETEVYDALTKQNSQPENLRAEIIKNRIENTLGKKIEFASPTNDTERPGWYKSFSFVDEDGNRYYYDASRGITPSGMENAQVITSQAEQAAMNDAGWKDEKLTGAKIKKILKNAGFDTDGLSIKHRYGGYSDSWDIDGDGTKVDLPAIERVLKNKLEWYETDERSGEILAGGNTFVFANDTGDYENNNGGIKTKDGYVSGPDMNAAKQELWSQRSAGNIISALKQNPNFEKLDTTDQALIVTALKNGIALMPGSDPTTDNLESLQADAEAMVRWIGAGTLSQEQKNDLANNYTLLGGKTKGGYVNTPDTRKAQLELQGAPTDEETELYRQLTLQTGNEWDDIAKQNGYRNYDEAVQSFLRANPGADASANNVLDWMDEDLMADKKTFTQAKSSDEIKYERKIVEEITDQFNPVSAPTKRSTRPNETFKGIYDELGLSDGNDIRKAVHYAEPGELVPTIIREAAGRAGVIDLTDAQRMVQDLKLNKRQNFTKTLDVLEDIIDSTPSTISGGKNGVDALELQRTLERMASDARGTNGTYRIGNKVVDQTTANNMMRIAKNIGENLDKAAADTGAVQYALNRYAPELQEMKNTFQGNEKWGKWADSVANAKSIKQLRSSIKNLTRASIYIEDGDNTYGTMGSRMSRGVGTLAGDIPTTKRGLINRGVNAIVDKIENTPAARNARLKHYDEQLAKATQARIDNAKSQAETASVPAEPIDTTTAEPVANEKPTPESQQLWNAIGRTEGTINGNQARTAQYLTQASNEINAQNGIDAGSTAVAINTAYGGTTASQPMSYEQERATYFFRPTGEYWPDMLSQAMRRAKNANDYEALGSLYEMYQEALSSGSGSSEEKLTDKQRQANAAQQALQNFEQAEHNLAYDLSDIPVIGGIANLGGNDYLSQAESLALQIGYMLSGATVNKDEARKIGMAYVPQPRDNETVRKNKIERLRGIISEYQKTTA